MALPTLEVNLDLPPQERWRALREYEPATAELVRIYKQDIGMVDGFREILGLYREAYLSEDARQEIDSIAAMTQIDVLDLTLVNVYYDAFKHAMACTAFATDTERGPLHARNLDWHSPGGALGRHSQLHVFTRAGQVVCRSLAWPGFIGVFTGVSPGHFSVSLNAVISEDIPGVGAPVSMILRDALTRPLSYSDALSLFAQVPLVCDCLLLVAGVSAGEFAVVERTPTRSAIRSATCAVTGHSIAATNDYRLLRADPENALGSASLQATSDARYATACDRVRDESPQDAAQCLAILDDSRVRMDITVQQAVMSAAEGTLVAVPSVR